MLFFGNYIVDLPQTRSALTFSFRQITILDPLFIWNDIEQKMSVVLAMTLPESYEDPWKTDLHRSLEAFSIVSLAINYLVLRGFCDISLFYIPFYCVLYNVTCTILL